MHYKNKRPVGVGDWAVGISHNSHGKPIVGIVLDMMPNQGNCNLKLHVWKEEVMDDGGHGETVIIPAHQTRGTIDYGDAKEFIRVDDGLRMVNAVVGSGNWDGPYFRFE